MIVTSPRRVALAFVLGLGGLLIALPLAARADPERNSEAEIRAAIASDWGPYKFAVVGEGTALRDWKGNEVARAGAAELWTPPARVLASRQGKFLLGGGSSAARFAVWADQVEIVVANTTQLGDGIFLDPGARVRVRNRQGDRVLVDVSGALPVKGWLSRSDLGREFVPQKAPIDARPIHDGSVVTPSGIVAVAGAASLRSLGAGRDEVSADHVRIIGQYRGATKEANATGEVGGMQGGGGLPAAPRPIATLPIGACLFAPSGALIGRVTAPLVLYDSETVSAWVSPLVADLSAVPRRDASGAWASCSAR